MTVLPFTRPDEPRLTAFELAVENRMLRRIIGDLREKERMQHWVIIILLVAAICGWAKALGS